METVIPDFKKLCDNYDGDKLLLCVKDSKFHSVLSNEEKDIFTKVYCHFGPFYTYYIIHRIKEMPMSEVVTNIPQFVPILNKMIGGLGPQFAKQITLGSIGPNTDISAILPMFLPLIKTINPVIKQFMPLIQQHLPMLGMAVPQLLPFMPIITVMVPMIPQMLDMLPQFLPLFAQILSMKQPLSGVSSISGTPQNALSFITSMTAQPGTTPLESANISSLMNMLQPALSSQVPQLQMPTESANIGSLMNMLQPTLSSPVSSIQYPPQLQQQYQPPQLQQQYQPQQLQQQYQPQQLQQLQQLQPQYQPQQLEEQQQQPPLQNYSTPIDLSATIPITTPSTKQSLYTLSGGTKSIYVGAKYKLVTKK